jgi:hypothetical protein
MTDENPGKDPKPKFDLNVNRKDFDWERPQITGSEIKVLAGSPTDYVVNQLVSGPGDDPEIGDLQPVELDHKAEPKGIKRFITRKPKTSPGAV